MEKPEQRYKASDVCRLAGVQPYVLRYWESEFPALAADRGLPGPRTYSARDLKVIERIKKLLHDEGYTIAGAKKKLDAELKGAALELVPPPLPVAALVPPPLPVSAEPGFELADMPSPEPARDPAATDPVVQPLPSDPPAERPRRRRTPPDSPAAPATLQVTSTPLFEGERIEVPVLPGSDGLYMSPDVEPPLEPFDPTLLEESIDTQPSLKAIKPERRGAKSAAAPSPDPRVALAVAELREILSLLSRDEP